MHASASVEPRHVELGNIAAIVVDANSGQTLYARNENELRHPASITKVMTLYLLFEQIEKGNLRLDSDLEISVHASRQAPTKLGLRPGQTISVDNAVKAVVTRSANDIAVAIAERIAGDEDSFAELMTRKAHALGMTRTHFANASGLPDDEQVTTAHDLAILGRAIQDRFPRHYRYFATHAFHYAGATIMNHNHLLDRVEGMDGIKTGYTRASGFNLLASVKRDGHFIVAAVMGGASAASRDRIMAGLIEDNIDNGAGFRTAAAITESAGGDTVAAAGERERTAAARWGSEAKSAETDSETSSIRAKLASAAAAIKPLGGNDPVRVASISPDVAFEKPRPAFVSGAAKAEPEDARALAKENNSKSATRDGSTARLGHASGAAATATPSAMRASAAPPAKEHDLDRMVTAKLDSSRGEAASAESHRPAAAHGGWMIQIGATDDIGKATALLARAKSEGAKALTSAQPFTEKVQKGSETLYRARFAGLGAESAELACKALKRSGFACFATRN
jgi:D-alanyl-D-alanine carboxypeptidase